MLGYRSVRRVGGGLCAGALVAVLAAGCARPTGNVAGTVTFNGKKLESGVVTFLGPDYTVTAPIKNDGTYVARNVPVGTVRITVETLPPPGTNAAKAAEPDKAVKVKPSGLDAGGASTSTGGKYTPIPAKYKDPDQSGLTYDVKEGNQRHDLELK